jgi:hypothetical protein
MKKVFFYSSVSDRRLFELTGFYVEDIRCLESIGLEIYTTNKVFDFFLFWKYDVAFLYFFKKSVIPGLIARCLRKKIIYTGGIDDLHSAIKVGYIKRSLLKAIFKIAVKTSDYCNMVSSSDFELANKISKKKSVLLNQKLVFFPHSIRIEEYNEIRCAKKEVIFSTICWMKTVSNVKRKGVDFSLKILSEIIKIEPEFKFKYFINLNTPKRKLLFGVFF